MKPLQIIPLVLAAMLAFSTKAQTNALGDDASGTGLKNKHAPKYANEAGPVHGWIALQAYLLLPAGPLKQEMAAYLPTSAGNPCYDPSFTSLPGWSGNLDAVDSSSPGTAVVEGAWEEDVPATDSRTHFWNPDGGFNAGLFVADPTLYHFDSALLVADAHFRNALIAYQAGQKSVAYYLLGRMAHLLADMSVPAHVLRDWHIPWITGQDGYEVYTARDANYTRITSTSAGVSIPNRSFLACYFDTPAGFDADMVNIFFDQASSAQRFDSDDVSGKSTDYGQGKYRLGWDALAPGKTLSRAELWNAVAGVPTIFERNLVRFTDYDVFTDCDNPQNIRICYYETFFNTYNNHADKRIKAFYTDGSNAFVDTDLDEITDIPDSIVKCIYQPKLEAEAIGHVAALYQLFWDKTHPATPVTAPTIASVSPTTMLTSNAPQPITIYGSNFKTAGNPNASSLIFFDPVGNPYLRSPSYATTTELRYNVTVQSAVGTWRVVVTNAGQTASAPANFTVVAPPPLTSGSLTVTLEPAGARASGAQWAVDGGTYRNSGDTVTDLTPGSHTVSCKVVAGYTMPANRSVTITGGAVTSETETYTVVTPSTYTLAVNSGVARYPDRATYSSGETVRLTAYTSPGWHFDHWSGDASGTTSPIDVVMDRDKTVTANYAPGDWSVGILNVTIEPASAVAAGARWRDNGGAWTNSGVTLNNAYIGNHYLEFSDAPPWKKPDARSVAVSGGQTTNVVVTYTQDATPGTLIVTLTPPDAVTAGAKWRVDGTQYSSGASVSLPPGSGYTVTFDSAPGWTPPPSQPATIQPGQTTLATGNYTPPAGQPVIGSIRPSIGRVAGGTLLTIDGANFDPPVSVTIDGRQASNVTVVSSTRVTCLTPARATDTNTVPVTVQTAGGTATIPNGFTYSAERGTNLNLVGSLSGPVNTADVKGNYAFIGQGSRLVVLDISTPSTPVPVGRGLLFPGTINNIKILGNFAYIADAEEGLQIVNIANPAQPSVVGTFHTPAPARAIAVRPGLACIAATSAGLQIVDVSDPANLRLVGSVDTEGWAFDVAVSVSGQGIFAYVANLYGTLKVVNVTDPASASIVGSLNMGGNCYSVAYSPNRVYVGSYGGFSVVNVSSPTNPAMLGSFAGGSAVGGGVAYSSGYLYVGGSGLRVVDVTTPGSPNEVGSLGGFSAFPAQITLVGGTNAFVSAGTDGLRIINVSNPTEPTERGQYVDFVGYAYTVSLANNTLYVANRNKAEILDIHDPAAPVRRSPFPSTLAVTQVRVFGNGAYIMDGNSMQIFDISNPQGPSLRGTIQDSMTSIDDIFVSGSVGYLTRRAMADGWRPTLSVYDLSQPSAPNPRSSLHLLPGNATDFPAGVVVRGSLAYIALSGAGLRIVDVTDYNSPQLRGLLTGAGPAWAVTLSADGTHALVACEAAGLKIVDVRDPDNPRLASSYAVEGALVRSVEVVGDLAYVAAGPAGVLVLDISDRTNPRLVRSYDTPGDAQAVKVIGSTLYVADGNGGIIILAIPDAEPPEVFITYPVFARLSPICTNSTASLALGGDAHDNESVSRLTWSNSRGGGGEVGGSLDSWFISGIALQPGTNLLTVTACDQAGNSGSGTLTVIYQMPKQDQTITFPAIANRTFGDAPFPLGAAASSGLDVSFSVVSGPASLSNNVLSLLGAGAVTVQASQPGNDFFNPAPPTNVSFTVAKADQGIAFAALPDKSAGDPPFALSATASSGLPVYFDIVSGPAVLDTNAVTLLGGGVVTVSAWQPGNSNYNAAVTVQRSFNVAKIPQTISFGPLSRQAVGDAPFPLTASASSGLLVSFGVLSGPAVLSGNIVTLTGAGLVTVRASQAGNDMYSPAANVDQAFYVVRGNNLITDAQRLPNGQFNLAFAGEFGRSYVVEYSADLESWTPLTTNALNSLGILEFTDGLVTNRTQSFYRVRVW